MFRAVCDCGQHRVVRGGELTSGHSRSCGCAYRHGMQKTPEWACWQAMKQRCINPLNPSYANYGGRGIVVCDRWSNSFRVFLADMGPRPSPEHSIDRIDNDGPYSPDNCRWATAQVQNNNRRVTRMVEFAGKRQSLATWAREVGIPFDTLVYRYKAGWAAERMLTTPLRGAA
jgi:hypothetical protein